MLLAFPKTSRFTVEGRLGEGGFGTVFRAFDRERKESVALKLLHQRSPAALYRFKREFRSIADFTHPNLVALHDLFHAEGDWFFTMELVDGDDFLSYVAHRNAAAEPSVTADGAAAVAAVIGAVNLTPWSADRARIEAAAVQLLEAVQTIHRRGLLHLDLKPTNVLVTREGRLVVLDFGLAHNMLETAEYRRGQGTPAYMSPEQADGSPISPASDWYAVGGLLHEALTGRLHEADDPIETDPLIEVCRRLLRPEPARRAAPEELRRVLVPSAAPLATSAPHEAAPPFVGRKSELVRLQAALELAARGRPVVARVVGDSGIGKSAICRQFLDSLEALKLEGRCYEQEHLPYKALDAIVDSLARVSRTLYDQGGEPRPLARLFPVFGRGDSHGDAVELRKQASEDLRELLQKVALSRPTVMFIDDLQWGDSESLQLLRELLAPATPLPVLFLFAHRKSGDHPILRALDALLGELGEPVVEITLGELSSEEAAEMAFGLGGIAPETLVRETAGVPFLIELLARSGAPQGEAASAEQSITAVLRRQIEEVAEPARTLLEMLAVAGQPLPPRLLGAATGVDAPTTHLSLLRRRNLVSAGRSEEARVECYHDRIRTAIVDDLPAPRRQSHHLKLAEALIGDGHRDAEEIFIHLDAGGEGRRAARYALQAADRAAAVFAFDHAASLYQAALRFPDEHGDPWQVKRRLGDALFNGGRTNGAGPVYLAASRAAPSGERFELERRAAESWMLGGQIDDGLELLEPHVARLGASFRRSSLRIAGSILYRLLRVALRGSKLPASRSNPEQLESVDLHWSIGRGLAFVKPLHGIDHILRSLWRALSLGDRERIARALSFVAGGVFFQITALRKLGLRLLAQADQLAQALGDPRLVASVALWRGSTEITHGNWQRADELMGQALRALDRDCQGVHWEKSVAAGMVAWLHQHRGELHSSREVAVRYLDEAEARGDLYSQVLFRQYLGFAEIAADRASETRRHARWITHEWCRGEFSVPRFYATLLETLSDLYEDRVGDARRRWSAEQKAFRRAGGHLAPVSRIDNALLEARLLAREGNLDAGKRRRLSQLSRQLAKEERRDGRAWAAWIDAVCAGGEASLEAAARAFEDCGLVMAATCAEWQLASRRKDDAAKRRSEELLITLGVAAPPRWVSAFLPIA